MPEQGSPLRELPGGAFAAFPGRACGPARRRIARLSHLRNPARSDVDTTILTEMQVGMALRRADLRGWLALDGR